MYVNTQEKGVVPSLLMNGVYEKYVTYLFKKIIKQGMIVVDIGANIGYYTLISAKLVGNKGKVYAFEPEPNNFEFLVKNVEINKYTNVITIQKAISNKHGKIELFVDKVNWGAASFSENNIQIQKGGIVEVEAVTLDEFFENVVRDDKVDFIKIDTQGAEELIVEGAEKVFKNNNLKIIMEFWPYGLKNVGTDPLKFLHKLQNYSFKIKYIDEINQCIKPIKIMKIIEICETTKDGKGFVDLLLQK